jgi:anti-sigma B factor antagonist
MDLQVQQRTDGDFILLLISGDLTLKTAWESPLADSVRNAIQAGHIRFVLDLGGVKSVDSMGIGQLVQALAAVRKRGGVMRLANLTRRVTEVLVLTNLLTVFDE